MAILSAGRSACALNDKLRSGVRFAGFRSGRLELFFLVRDKLDRFDRPEELAAYLATMARNKVGMEVRGSADDREVQRSA